MPLARHIRTRDPRLGLRVSRRETAGASAWKLAGSARALCRPAPPRDSMCVLWGCHPKAKNQTTFYFIFRQNVGTHSTDHVRGIGLWPTSKSTFRAMQFLIWKRQPGEASRNPVCLLVSSLSVMPRRCCETTCMLLTGYGEIGSIITSSRFQLLLWLFWAGQSDHRRRQRRLQVKSQRPRLGSSSCFWGFPVERGAERAERRQVCRAG